MAGHDNANPHTAERMESRKDAKAQSVPNDLPPRWAWTTLGEIADQAQNPLTREDLDEFVTCFRPENRHARTQTWSENNPTGRWRAFAYDELMARDKVNLDIFWLRDESLEDTAGLPDPDVLATEIVEDLQAAL